MKFKEFFSEPQHMSDGSYAIDGTILKEKLPLKLGTTSRKTLNRSS
jgi:hypothetical protein